MLTSDSRRLERAEMREGQRVDDPLPFALYEEQAHADEDQHDGQ